MPRDDLLDHAKSSKDFYALLGDEIHEGSTEKEIARAYRRAALKSHPDQNPDDPTAVERFHSLQIAYEVLTDPAAKQAYDTARAAKKMRQKQDELLSAKRKAMKEDLERREAIGLKRKRDKYHEMADGDEELAMKLKRTAEQNRRVGEEIMRQMQREAEARAAAVEAAEAAKKENAHNIPRSPGPPGGTNVPEMTRAVKVRWVRKGPGEKIDSEDIKRLFSKYGAVDCVIMLPDRKMRLGEGSKKRKIATSAIVYESIVNTYEAVEEVKKETGDEWQIFETIEWAEGKEPDFLQFEDMKISSPAATSGSPATTLGAATSIPPPAATSNLESIGSTTSNSSAAEPSTTQNGKKDLADREKVPVFTSFKGARRFNPFDNPALNKPDSPSREEITLIRMKQYEKKRRAERALAAAAEEERNREKEAEKSQNGD